MHCVDVTSQESVALSVFKVSVANAAVGIVEQVTLIMTETKVVQQGKLHA